MRRVLIAISGINALSALICGVLIIVAPDGSMMAMESLLPLIADFPLASIFFRDLLWIGVAMLLILCLPNAISTAALLGKMSAQYQLVIGANILIMLWTVFQFVYLFNGLAVAYFLLGAAMVIIAARLSSQSV